MKYILISGSSGIGSAIINDLKDKGHEIISTYNTSKNKKMKGLTSFKLNLSSRRNIKQFTKNKILNNWNCLVILAGSQNPIGLFNEVKGEDWCKSLDLNFTNQMYLIRELIKKRSNNKNILSNIILWAGTGSNSAPKYYSAYTISKIAQTKMTELLDKEFDDIKFSIIGPGWVKTKIHQQTIEAGKVAARENYQNTIDRFKLNKFNPMKDVVKCFNKIVSLSKKAGGGRNFSVQFDKWNNKNFYKVLENDENIYKLRRDFNDLQISDLDFDILDILDLIKKNNNFQKKTSIFYKIFIRIIHMKIIFDSHLKKLDIKIIEDMITTFLKSRKKRKIIVDYLSSKKIKYSEFFLFLKK